MAAPAFGPAPNPAPHPASASQPSIPRASLSSLDPAMREHLRAMDGLDVEQSVEIPPPKVAPLPSERPPGAKDPYVGTTFDGRYKIERQLGEGGMGVVYLARHKVIDKKVAVKVLRADLAKDREMVDRFVQEAKSASSIGNPHIIDIADFGDLPDGSTYFVMEYLEGDPLTKSIEAKMDVKRLCDVAMQIADGLAAAHTAGIVHRDLKPDNIYLVTRGAKKDFVKILDFGIAKVSNSGTTKLTRAGAVFGTPHYMSPEQAAGHPVDHRADIYSLGVIMYEMTSGQLPFNADNFMGILTQHMYKAPVPIRALVNTTECPPGLEAIVQKCLSKKPDMRYATMEDLAEDIRRLLRGESPLAVAELMNRSAGFSVPIDYFKTASPTLAQSERGKRGSMSTILVAGGVFAAIVLVGGLVVATRVTPDAGIPARPAPAEKASVAPATTPAPVASVPITAASASAAIANGDKVVALAASPESATAKRGGETLKLPATIRIPAGEKVTVVVEATGYKSQSVELDGSAESRTVRLEQDAAPAVPRPPSNNGGGSRPPPPRPPAASGGGELRDPWK